MSKYKVEEDQEYIEYLKKEKKESHMAIYDDAQKEECIIPKSYKLNWLQFDRNDRVEEKEKIFKTMKALTSFSKKLEDKSNFYKLVGTAYEL